MIISKVEVLHAKCQSVSVFENTLTRQINYDRLSKSSNEAVGKLSHATLPQNNSL